MFETLKEILLGVISVVLACQGYTIFEIQSRENAGKITNYISNKYTNYPCIPFIFVLTYAPHISQLMIILMLSTLRIFLMKKVENLFARLE